MMAGWRFDWLEVERFCACWLIGLYEITRRSWSNPRARWLYRVARHHPIRMLRNTSDLASRNKSHEPEGDPLIGLIECVSIFLRIDLANCLTLISIDTRLYLLANWRWRKNFMGLVGWFNKLVRSLLALGLAGTALAWIAGWMGWMADLLAGMAKWDGWDRWGGGQPRNESAG